MAVRCMEMRRILKSTGTLWLHCDQTAGHCLKALLDCIFGEKNLVAEVTWHSGSRCGAIPKHKPGKAHENLFAYAALRAARVPRAVPALFGEIPEVVQTLRRGRAALPHSHERRQGNPASGNTLTRAPAWR